MSATTARIRWTASAVTLAMLLAAGCSKAPKEKVADAGGAAGGQGTISIAPKDASRQAERLIAKIDPRAECERFRVAIREAGQGSPASGKTQMAFSTARRAADEAGCLMER